MPSPAVPDVLAALGLIVNQVPALADFGIRDLVARTAVQAVREADEENPDSDICRLRTENTQLKAVVTVCDSCLRASCWHMEFPCDEQAGAGTVDLPIAALRALGREHPSYWQGREHPTDIDVEETHGG